MVNIITGVLVLAVASSVLCQDLPVGYNVRSVTGSGAGEQCPATQNVRETIKQDLCSLINNTVLPALATQNQTQTGNTSQICGCGGPGWRRVAYLNMSDPAQTCLPAWSLFTSPRSCGRPSSAGRQSCILLCFPIKMFNTLRYVEESLATNMANLKHSWLVT